VSGTKGDRLRKLRSLEGTPAEQADYAVQLLSASIGLEVIKAALAVLAKNPMPKARSALRDLYWHYTENDGKRDPAAYTRSAILTALHPIMGMDDTELVVDAVTTYQFLPPGFEEEAALLRSTAIVLLSELDDRLAAFFAARLLADGYTEAMSGEPALTAARVLAAQGELLPLYSYVVRPQQGAHPEIVSECMRNLGNAPDEVIDELVDQFGASDNRAALVGLFDMLVSGSQAPRHSGFLANYLRDSEDSDLYRYLVTIMLTSPIGAVRQTLVDTVQGEEDPYKSEVLREVLAFAPAGPDTEPLLEKFA
jgi:hypothetical protein